MEIKMKIWPLCIAMAGAILPATSGGAIAADRIVNIDTAAATDNEITFHNHLSAKICRIYIKNSNQKWKNLSFTGNNTRFPPNTQCTANLRLEEDGECNRTIAVEICPDTSGEK